MAIINTIFSKISKKENVYFRCCASICCEWNRLKVRHACVLKWELQVSVKEQMYEFKTPSLSFMFTWRPSVLSSSPSWQQGSQKSCLIVHFSSGTAAALAAAAAAPPLFAPSIVNLDHFFYPPSRGKERLRGEHCLQRLHLWPEATRASMPAWIKHVWRSYRVFQRCPMWSCWVFRIKRM